MFGTIALTVLLASASALVARADVVPSVPGPGITYNAGSTCRIEWDGDKDSNTMWKDMSIQLMTGSNFEMVHLTTVASNQDGTASGFFEHICPEVNPYSAIYFYQFTAPLAADKQWATRFTIASPTGASVPPPNANQPGTGEKIPWGIGALVDPSTAVPPPASANSTTTPVPSGSETDSTSSTSSPPDTTEAGTTSASNTRTIATITADTNASSTAKPSTAANTTASTGVNDNAAVGTIVIDTRVWVAVVALGASALAFTVVL